MSEFESNLLEVENLTCQRGYTQLFSGLNFILNTGDILRIAGQNGTGKTSLLRLIAGLSFAETGQITLNNQIPNDISYQENLLYLGHSNALNPDLSVLDNLLFIVHLKQSCNLEQAKQALDKVSLAHYYHQPCSSLSAGQKRRVLLASLLLIKVPLWLLDEPFTALDTQGVTLVEDLVLAHTKNGGACVFTTHQDSRINKYKELIL